LRPRTIVGAALALAVASPPSAQALTFAPCSRASRVQCAGLDVPLDHAGRVPGSLRVNVERIPARGTSRGALFVLEGGPGFSVTTSAEYYAHLFRRQLADRDLILADQRGTGLSGALRRCPGLKIRDIGPASGQAAVAARCAVRLGPAAGLYTTQAAAGDMESLRQALGLDKIAIYGSSYGTKLALAYAALYPAHVDRMVLDSVLPLDGGDPDVDSLQAVARVLDKLCAAACERITTDPVGDTAALVAAMRRRGVLEGPVRNAHGRRRTGRIERLRLANILFAGDYFRVLRAEYPGAVKSALRGDIAPLLRLAIWAARGSKPEPLRSYSEMMLTANECQEGPFLWDRSASPSDRLAQARARIAALPPSATYPFDTYTAFKSAEAVQLCWQWPLAGDPPIPTDPFPAVPALLLAGEDDLRTPLESAERVAKAIPGAQLVTVPGLGHGVLGAGSACPDRAVNRFFAGLPPLLCRPGTRPPFALPVAPRSLREVQPARGRRGVVGRTLEAVKDTVRDAYVAAAAALYSDRGFARAGGLRGGYMQDEPSRMRLHGYSYVPGVGVSGILTGGDRDRGALHVTGRAAARGRVFLHRDGSISGTLAGHRVRAGAAIASSRSLRLLRGGR
jgi:pimeloyl-ACP methyl ester carboxylesterase